MYLFSESKSWREDLDEQVPIRKENDENLENNVQLRKKKLNRKQKNGDHFFFHRRVTWKSCSSFSLFIEGDGEEGRGKEPLRVWSDELTETPAPPGPVLRCDIDPPSPPPIPGDTDLHAETATRPTSMYAEHHYFLNFFYSLFFLLFLRDFIFIVGCSH